MRDIYFSGFVNSIMKVSESLEIDIVLKSLSNRSQVTIESNNNVVADIGPLNILFLPTT
jgi:hypothetical protein